MGVGGGAPTYDPSGAGRPRTTVPCSGTSGTTLACLLTHEEEQGHELALVPFHLELKNMVMMLRIMLIVPAPAQGQAQAVRYSFTFRTP